MVNFYILKKCLVYWRFERITRNCRKYDIRLLCVEFIRWQCACKQRACNARDKWDLLTSFFHVKSYGYIFFYWSASAAYVSLDAPDLDLLKGDLCKLQRDSHFLSTWFFYDNKKHSQKHLFTKDSQTRY